MEVPFRGDPKTALGPGIPLQGLPELRKAARAVFMVSCRERMQITIREGAGTAGVGPGGSAGRSCRQRFALPAALMTHTRVLPAPGSP